MKNSGVDVDRYVAYEIDKYAIKVATHNFPEIEECGDVFKADFTQYEGFDYVSGLLLRKTIAKQKQVEKVGIGFAST